MSQSIRLEGNANINSMSLEHHDRGVNCTTDVLPDFLVYHHITLSDLPPDEAELLIFRTSKLSASRPYGFASLACVQIDKVKGVLVLERPRYYEGASLWDHFKECSFLIQSYSLLCWKTFIFLLRVIRGLCIQGSYQNAWLDILNTALQNDLFKYIYVADTGLLVIDTTQLVVSRLRSGTSTVQRISNESTPVILEATLMWALGFYFAETFPKMIECLELNHPLSFATKDLETRDPALSSLFSVVNNIANGTNSLPAAQVLSISTVRKMERQVDKTCQIYRSDRGFTQLMTAAKENNVEDLKLFMYQCGLTSSTPLGLTALMIAVRNRSLQAVEVLGPIEACNVDTTGYTALMYCVQNKLYGGAKVLAPLEGGMRSRDNKTAIFLAYEQEDYNMMEILAPWENHLMYLNGRTLLMIASEENNLPAVNLLVNYEGGVSDKSGHMAARYALLNGNREVFKVLLPVEQSVLRKFNCTPLMIAVANDDVKEVTIQVSIYPKRRFKGLTALMIAVLVNANEDILDMLAKKEARLTNNKGQTALMLAIQKNLLPYIIKLAPLEAGMYDKKGNTALMYAILSANLDAVEELIAYEAGLVNPCTDKTASQMLDDVSSFKLPGAIRITQIVKEYESFKRDSYGDTPLIHAVIANDTTMFNSYLKLSRIRNNLGRTALHFATELGHMCFIQPLVEAGAAGLQDYSGVTALMLHVANGGTDYLDLLIDRGEAGHVDNDGKSALIIALETGNIVAALKLASFESGIIDNNGVFASKIAAIHGYTDVFSKLYECEKNLLYNDGFTPLMLAAILNDIRMLRQALQVGARTTLQDGEWSALMLSVIHGNQEACRLLLPVEGCMVNSEGKTALMLAAELDMNNMIKILAKAEAGKRDYRGTTALMYAAMRGHPENVLELVKYEAGIANNAKQTAASLAYWAKRRHIFCLLSQIDLDIRDSNGETELMKAVMCRDINMINDKIHLACLKNYRGETALMMAVKEEFLEAVEVLSTLECGIQDFNGTTALILACESSFMEAVALLLCEVNLCRFDGSSPRSVALTRNHFALGKLLPKKPLLDSAGCTQLMLAIEIEDEALALTPQMLALQGVQDYNGKTALMRAAEKNMYKVVEALVDAESKTLDYDGQTAAEYAYNADALDALAILIQYEALLYSSCEKQSIFMRAVSAKNERVIRITAEHEAGYQTSNGTTALLLAQRLTGPGSKEILDLVLQFESSSTIKDDNNTISSTIQDETDGSLVPHDIGRDHEGNTALMRMVRSSPTGNITPFLHQAGLVNRKGLSALMIAAEVNNIAAARLLADKEAGHTIASHVSAPFVLSDATSLHVAAIRGNTEIVELLVKHEARMVDYRKRTALMLAAYFGHLSVVRLLIDKEKKFQDSNGRTALFYAIENNKIHVIRELIPHETTITTNSEYMAGPGFTALMDAARLGNVEAIRLLIAQEAGMAQPKDSGKHSNWSALVWAASHGQKEALLELAPLELETYGMLAFYYAQDLSITEALVKVMGKRALNN